MKIHLTRGSVCAADDVNAPHSRVLDIKSASELPELIESLYESYLPKIQGGAASWSVFTDKPIAVISAPENKVQYFFEMPEKLIREVGDFKSLNMHVNYHVQIESKIVFEVISEARPAQISGHAADE